MRIKELKRNIKDLIDNFSVVTNHRLYLITIFNGINLTHYTKRETQRRERDRRDVFHQKI